MINRPNLSAIDPTFQKNLFEEDSCGWWFWDETQTSKYGPWSNEKEARDNLKIYCDYLDNGTVRPFSPYLNK